MRVLLQVANILSIKGLVEVLIAAGIFILNSAFMYLFHILRGSIPSVIPYVFQQYAVNADSLYGSISVPSVYLQNLLTHPALKATAIWVWSTYFPVVFFAPSIIYLLRLRFTAQYIIAQVLVIMLGLLIYATLPTAPPWMAVAECDRLVNMTAKDFVSLDPNPTAAMPSVHAAIVCLLACVGWHYGRVLQIIFLSYAAVMGFCLVYLGEHYVFDVLVGVAVTFVAWQLAGWIEVKIKMNRPVAGMIHGYLVVVMALSVLIRIPFIHVPMISDEGGYAYTAYFWSDDYQLYKDIPFDRPQGIFLLYKLALATFGHNVSSIRLFASIYNAVTTLAIFALAKRLFSPTFALISAIVFAVFSASPSIEGFTANAELFTLLPITIAAYLTWRRNWFWAGLLAGIASAIKPSGVSGLVFAFTWIALNDKKPRHFINVGIGFGLVIMLSVIHGCMIEWDAYWDSIVENRLNSFSVVTMPFLDQLISAISGFYKAFPALGIPLLLALFAADKDKSKETRFLMLWFASCCIGMFIGGMWNSHYFQQIIPALSLLSPQAILAWRRRTTLWIWPAMFALVLAFFVVIDLPHWFSSPNSVSWSIYRRPAYIYADKIGAFIQRECGPEDSVYVAFSEAQVYYLSKRRNAGPNLYYNEILYAKGLFEKSVECIREGKPKVVLISNNPPRNRMTPEEFEAIVAARYIRVQDFGPITGWVRRP